MFFKWKDMDYIEIKGYKSIKSEKVDLGPINILIGANGSGKSNFISFFDFLNKIYNKKLNDHIALSGGSDKILHKGKKHTKEISFKIEFDEGISGYACTLISGVDGFIFTEERLSYQNDKGIDISRSLRETNIQDTDTLRADFVVLYLHSFRRYHFHDTSDTSPFSKFSHIKNDKYFLYSDGSNLAAFLYNIKENHKIVYNRIIKTIQSIAPYFLDFSFYPSEKDFLSLQWVDRYSEVVFGPSDLSDGTLRFMALATLFLQPDLPKTIIIDEPELGLHPSAIAKLSSMIKSASAKGAQVIIATQSTDLISYFMPEDIIAVDQIEGETKFQRLNSDSLSGWLNDYTIDDLWKRNIISVGQPNF